MFEYHRDNLIRELHESILLLKNRAVPHRIIPFLSAPSGGGAGSALQILLAHALTDPQFVSQVTEGFGADVLEPPLMFVVEPFAYAMRSNLMHRDNILPTLTLFGLKATSWSANTAFSNASTSALPTVEARCSIRRKRSPWCSAPVCIMRKGMAHDQGPTRQQHPILAASPARTYRKLRRLCWPGKEPSGNGKPEMQPAPTEDEA